MYDMKGVFVPKRKVLSLCYTIESVFSKGDPCEKLISIRGILEQFQNAIFIQKKKKVQQHDTEGREDNTNKIFI